MARVEKKRTRAPAAVRGAASLVLREKGGVLEILAGNVVLLSSAALETERALRRLAAPSGARARACSSEVSASARPCAACSRSRRPTRASSWPRRSREVVDLVRGELAHRAGGDRSTIRACRGRAGRRRRRHARARTGAFDAILLDVDNGPHWASFRTNARLYTPAGLASARRALAPGGVFAVWSGYPADAFLARLRAAGFAPSCVLLQERGRVRARAYVGIARADRFGLPAALFRLYRSTQRDPRSLRGPRPSAAAAPPTGWCWGCSTRSST